MPFCKFKINKQQLEILVLLALYIPCISAHRHTTIVINETVANSSVGPWNPSSGRVNIANGNRVSNFGAHDHVRHKLYWVSSMIRVYLRYACGYGYIWTHIGLQKPYCCIIWSSNLNIWMLSFCLYFDQYFQLFRTIQQFNAMVFMQVGCLRTLRLCII